jgi:hypothetical protein
MTVRELNQQQLDELKTRVFYLNEGDSMYESLMEAWDDEIEIKHEKAQWITDISNETIYKLFGGFTFVKEDFSTDSTTE